MKSCFISAVLFLNIICCLNIQAQNSVDNNQKLIMPESISIKDVLADFDVGNLTGIDCFFIDEKLKGKIITDCDSSQRILWDNNTVGTFDSWIGEGFAIFIFSRFLGKIANQYIFQCENIIIYPFGDLVLYCKQVTNDWYEDAEKEYIFWDLAKRYTIFGLYKYPTDMVREFEKVYFPQDVIIIENQSGKMELAVNINKWYKLFTDE
jgi:hypothetical protein